MLVSSLNGAVPISGPVPSVSIILPTYNRAKFLPQAFESIRSQEWADWELIVVDDGSTDETRALVEKLSREVAQSVVYIHQENQGAYGARNTGLDHASGKYIAFFDSDDIWLPHHLKDCAEALEANGDVDWVYGACRIQDLETGSVLEPTTFFSRNELRPFAQLRTRPSGALRIIEDPFALRCAIRHGLYCGLQNSLIRACVLAPQRFETRFRNEGEDALMSIRAMARGHRFGYFEAVHVHYQIHGDNSSAAANGQSFEKRLGVHQAILEGLADLMTTLPLPAAEARALRHAYSEHCFWRMGYALLWQHGHRQEALQMFRKAIALWPWNWRYWKTAAIAHVRSMVNQPSNSSRSTTGSQS